MFVPPSVGTGVAPTPRLLERLLPCAWGGGFTQPSQGLRPALRPWTHHVARPLALRADAPGALPAPRGAMCSAVSLGGAVGGGSHSGAGYHPGFPNPSIITSS